MPAGDGGLLRPIDEPMLVPFQFDFQEVLGMAMASRPELRRQAKVVESHRMEWLAARNLRLPSVDLVGSYRVHGFGNSVFGNANVPQGSSMNEFLNGNLQDIAAGLEITRPIGNRLAATAERNAMVAISRENAILEAQQLEISHEVTSALAEIERCLRAVQTSDERVRIARQAFENLSAKFDEGISIPKENILQSNRVLVELELWAAIARVDYSIALASLAVAQGTLLNEVAVFCGQEPAATYLPASVIDAAAEPVVPANVANDGTSTATRGRPTLEASPLAGSGVTLSASFETKLAETGMARVSLSPPQVD
jgi:outer membrane protein TolC